jgi:hypothetical protein
LTDTLTTRPDAARPAAFEVICVFAPYSNPPPWMYTATGSAFPVGCSGAHTFRFRQSSPIPLSASSQSPLSGWTETTPLRS